MRTTSHARSAHQVPTVLLTGFEPFGGDARNPSGDAVLEVARSWSGPERLVTAVLPVAFEAARTQVRALLAEHRPELVLAVGVAGGRDALSPERVAVNLMDARIPDNAGARPVDEPVVAGGPAAHFATVPVKAIAQALREAGLPAAVSHTAGTFVCNHVFYVAAHEASVLNEDHAHAGNGTETRGQVRVGFLHVPWSAETVPAGDDDTTSALRRTALPAADLARAVSLAVRTALDVREDLSDSSAGTLH